MASDDIMLIGSAIDKLREFVLLGYPKGMLYDACTKMAVISTVQRPVVSILLTRNWDGTLDDLPVRGNAD